MTIRSEGKDFKKDDARVACFSDMSKKLVTNRLVRMRLAADDNVRDKGAAGKCQDLVAGLEGLSRTETIASARVLSSRK